MTEVKICCDYFKKMGSHFRWFMRTDDATGEQFYLMPSLDFREIEGDHTTQFARVNHCPSCGEYVRNIEIPSEQFKNEIRKYY